MSRVGAALVAIGLITGAVVVRNAINDDPGSSERTGVVRVVCAEELVAACETLATLRYTIVPEAATTTADRLATGGPPNFDVWVVAEPWPEVVDDARTRAGLDPLFGSHGPPVARSPLVAVGAITDGCDWKCIGTSSARLGAAAATSGLGVLELGAASSGHLGRTDFAANDLDTAFRSWFDGYVRRLTPTDQPVTRLLQSRAFFDVALSFEADARRALDAASADRKVGLRVQYPAPVAYLDVVVVDIGAALASRAHDAPASIGAALRGAGWKAPNPGGPSGFPRPGVLTALRELI